MNLLRSFLKKQMKMKQRINNINQENPLREDQENVLLLEGNQQENKLVLYNDDFNTFDFVIECLIDICGHTMDQATQCTMLVHYKGQCTVKTGSLDILKPMHEKLLSKGLTSEILLKISL